MNLRVLDMQGHIVGVNGGGYIYHNDTIIGFVDDIEVDINEYNTNLNLIALWLRVEVNNPTLTGVA